MTNRIAVLSDTHNLLRPGVEMQIKQCDAVIHGGDIASREAYESIIAVAQGKPSFFVRGNADEKWAMNEQGVPFENRIELFGVSFYMVHKKKDISKSLTGVDVVVYGHSHKYADITDVNGMRFLNPGSCGPRRLDQEISMAVVCIDDGRIDVQKIVIPNDKPQREHLDKYKMPAESDMLRVIEQIMARMEKGQTIAQISKALKTDSEFVDNICRIIVTHPGVTAGGILDKVEVNHLFD